MALRSTHRNLDEAVEELAWPFSEAITNSEEYQELKNTLWPMVEPRLAFADDQTNKLNQNIDNLRATGKVLQQAKQDRELAEANLEQEYNNLGSPKILFRCNGDLSLLASKSRLDNYNAILENAREHCQSGRFEIVESEKQ